MYTILVGNKADDDEKREVETRLGDCFALQNGMRYFETSAKNSDVEKIFEHLTQVLLCTKKPSPPPAKPKTPSLDRGDRGANVEVSYDSFKSIMQISLCS